MTRLGDVTVATTASLRALYALIAILSRAKTGFTPVFPMTVVSQKDLLFAKSHEFEIAQQTVDRVRSEMLCIIATLPDGGKSNDERCEKQMFFPVLEKVRDSRKNRPVVVMTPQSDALVSEQSSTSATKETPKKTRSKRATESDIRKAVKLVYDESLKQKEAEIVCNLPIGTLSRRKGKQIMEQYLKEWGKPTRIDVPPKVRRKEAENAFRYGEK